MRGKNPLNGLRYSLMIALFVTAPLWCCWGQPGAAASPEEQPTEVTEEVTTEEVKRFLDPTTMINSIGYVFQANFLIKDVELFTHRIKPEIAFTHWTAVWADIPIQHFSIPGEDDPAGEGPLVTALAAARGASSRASALARPKMPDLAAA